MLIHLFCLRMVADIDHFNVLIGSAEEQVEQDIKTFGHIFGGLIHRAGYVHQAEHHGLAGRVRALFIIFVA